MESEMRLFVLMTLLVLPLPQSDGRKPVLLSSNFCSDFPAATTSCRSFKELVDHKDPEVLGILRHKCRVGGGQSGTTYVCFKGEKDSFVVLAFNMPDQWEKGAHGLVKGESSMCLDEYENGIPGGSQEYAWLDWQRNEDVRPIQAVTRRGKSREVGTIDLATVDPAEVVVSYSDHKLNIRRSTNRFVDSYGTVKNPRIDTGHCAVFEGEPK
jgi:hypothetical protein